MTGPPDDDGGLGLEIRRVAADPQPDGTLLVEIETSRGPIPAIFHPHEGSDGAVVWLSGAIGGFDGPADGVYTDLASNLVGRGITSLRLNYRRPGELRECALDALAGVSMLKGLGARRVALVGHSFGGAVVIVAGALSPLVVAVAALSSQTYGATGAARLAPRPLLLIHGEDDTRLSSTCSQQIYDWALEPKQLILYPGAGHSLRECGTELREALANWLLRLVGPSLATSP